MRGGRRVAVEEGLDGSPGAEFIVDAASENKFLVESADGGGLDVKEFQFPVYNCGVCVLLVNIHRS